jgi:ABC-type transporter Mla maintaining outer membrane lipid asymmetry ATPase subunit MlaF
MPVSNVCESIFSIQGAELAELRAGDIFWWPVASAREGEFALAEMDGASPPEPGRFFYRGRDIARFSRREWLAYLARTAFLTPSGDLIGNLSVLDNLLVTTLPHVRGASRELMRRIEREVSGEFFVDVPDAERFFSSLPYQLTIVERARAAVLRAALRGAEWIVRTDEPPGLEPCEREEYHALLGSLRARLPDAPWLFICGRSELPDAFQPVKTIGRNAP